MTWSSTKTAIVATAISLQACGGSSFPGTYSGTQTQSVTCGSDVETPQNSALSIDVTENGDTLTIAWPTCGNLTAAVNGNSATLEPSTCPPRTNSDGSVTVFSWTTGTLTLSGATLVLNLQGTSTVTANGETSNCADTVGGTLSR